MYDEIYKVKIHEITLRELLLMQSFYICANESDIQKLVYLQPDPKLFYKTFLELDFSNLASIMAFNSFILERLLSADN